MVPKNEKQDLDKFDLHLSEQLSKLCPEIEDAGADFLTEDDDQKINELPIPELTEILSKIDNREMPKQLEFFLIESKFKIHIESRNIFFENLDANESTYGFFQI